MPKTRWRRNEFINCKRTDRTVRTNPRTPRSNYEKYQTYNTHGILADYVTVYNATEPAPVAHKLYSMQYRRKCQELVSGDSKTEPHYKFIINNFIRTRRYAIHRLSGATTEQDTDN